jgi:bacteriorhodopsin
MSWVVVVSGLAGAFTTTRYKWGFYVFGVLALLYIAYVIFAPSGFTIVTYTHVL